MDYIFYESPKKALSNDCAWRAVYIGFLKPVNKCRKINFIHFCTNHSAYI